jgi:septum formation topological specificity factor MinE
MIQGGIYMAALAVEIVNVDEDAAEKVARQAIELISKIVKVKSNTLEVQPHDDYRGVWLRVDIELPSDVNKSYKTSLVSTLKGLIENPLYLNNKAGIHVSIQETNKGEK